MISRFIYSIRTTTNSTINPIVEIQIKIKKYLTLSILTFFSLAGYAKIDVSISLEKAIEKAIEKNRSIRNKKLEIEKLNLQEKGGWNKYIPTLEATAIYFYFDNRLTIDLPTATIPILNYPPVDGKIAFDNYGNLFNRRVMAKTVLFSGLQILNAAKALQ